MDVKAIPAFVKQHAGESIIFLMCPKMLRDMMTTKNELSDKVGFEQAFFTTLLGTANIFAGSDDVWKHKRKVARTGFYKDKVMVMTETFKKIALEKVTQLKTEIAASKDGTTRFHLETTILGIYASTIFLVCFGEDISMNPIEIHDKGKDQTVTVLRALQNFVKALMVKSIHPMRMFSHRFDTVALNEVERTTVRDCNRLR